MRLTEEQFEALQTERSKARPAAPAKKHPRARVRQPQKARGDMSQAEIRYLEGVILPAIASGALAWYGYETQTLRLGEKTTYTPDFSTVDAEGFIRMIEVKGRKSKRTIDKATGLEVIKDSAYWPEDSRVKIKVAARMFPYEFVAVSERHKENGGGWQEEKL